MQKYYVSGNVSIAVVSKKTKTEDKQKKFEQIEKIVKSPSRSGTLKFASHGLPFKNLPRLIAYGNRLRDGLRVTFQVETTYARECEFEALKFVSYGLLGILREKFHENKLVHHLTTKTEYFNDFGLLHVDCYFSHAGKSSVDAVIATILAGVEEVRRNNNIDYYSRLAEQLRIVYNTAPVLSSAMLAQEFARKVPKFGFQNSFRATKTLNKYRTDPIEAVLKQLNDDNLLVSLFGDFTEGPVQAGPNGDVYDKRIDLREALSQRVTKSFSFDTKSADQHRVKPSSILLSGEIPGLKLRYHSQGLNEDMMTHLRRLAKKVEFRHELVNPYAIPLDFSKVVGGEVDQSTAIRAPFNSANNLVTDGKFNFFFRSNKMFPLPTTYLNLRFMLPVEGSMIDLKEKISHHMKTLILLNVWRRRTSLIRLQVEEYHGKVELEFVDNVISLEVYCNNLHFEQLLRDVLSALSMESRVTDEEYFEGLDSLYRSLLAEDSSFEQVQRDLEMVLTKYTSSNQELIGFINQNHAKFKASLVNPTLVFGLLEGDVDEGRATAYLAIVKEKYRVGSMDALKHETVGKFEQTKINIFRFNKNEQVDNHRTVVLAVDLGKLSLMNYILAKLFQVFFEKELVLTFVKNLKIADRVSTRVHRVSDHLILEFISKGTATVQKTETEFENLLTRAEKVLGNMLNEEFMKRWRKVTSDRLQDEKNSVFEYAHEDSSDIFLSYGKHSDLRRRTIDMLKENVSTEEALSFMKHQLINGKRLYYEFYSNPTDATDIGPLSARPVQVHVENNNLK